MTLVLKPDKWGNFAERRMAWAMFAPGKGFFSRLGTDSSGKIVCRTTQDPAHALTWDGFSDMCGDINGIRRAVLATKPEDDPFSEFVEVKVVSPGELQA